LFSFLSIAILLSGCTSIGKGVTEAILEKPKAKIPECARFGVNLLPASMRIWPKAKENQGAFCSWRWRPLAGYTTEFWKIG
jgi:hypothetical protein